MQRVEVEKLAGDWFWGEIAPFFVGWLFGLDVWLFFVLFVVVGCCLLVG